MRAEIERALPDAASKVWHGAPVWFVGNTPVVGYSVPARGGVALLFWNGQAFGDPALKPMGKFKAAQVEFEHTSEIKAAPLRRWLKKAGTELWDIRSIRGKSGRPSECDGQTACGNQVRGGKRTETQRPGRSPRHRRRADGHATVQGCQVSSPQAHIGGRPCRKQLARERQTPLPRSLSVPRSSARQQPRGQSRPPGPF
ncbi:MAG: DUF1801 domain-containing protein [Phycisphaerae bacterium]